MKKVKRVVELIVMPPTSLYLGVALGLALAWHAGRRAKRDTGSDGSVPQRLDLPLQDFQGPVFRGSFFLGPGIQRAIGLGVAGLSALLLVALSVPQNAFWLLDSLQTAEAIPPTATSIEADAIVVFAGDVDCDPPEYGPDQPGAISLQRCRYGAALARRTGLPLLISGGVLRPDRRPVALVLRDFVADELGVPVRWTEERSHTTRENARFSAEILKANGIQRIALVTHAWHMPRAIAVCEDVGLTVLPAPTAAATPPANLRDALVPRASAFQHSYWALHEWVGRAWYSLSE